MLEALLRRRAATGRDVSPAPLPPRTAPTDADNAKPHPGHEPFRAQAERLYAERARFDALADPKHLPTPEEIEAEILARPIGRSIDDVRRDLGVIAMICTMPFWDKMTDAIAAYQHGTAAERLDDTPPLPEPVPQQQPQNAAPAQPGRSPNPYPSPRPPICNIGTEPADPFGRHATCAWPRRNVSGQRGKTAVPPAAMGPPRAALRLAA